MNELITSEQGTLEYSKKLNSELLQPNQISQGLYKCSPLAKQLLAYVIADLKIMKWSNLNIETYETTFKTSDFVKALGKSRIGSKQKDLIKSALVELQKSYIAIDTGKKFETFSWVTHAVFSDVDHKINIEINHHLGQALVEYKHGFTTLQLIELGRLQSFYAMRYYEIALSWIGKKGKEGNKKGCWYFEYTVDELRKTFQLGDNEYSGRMTNFITKVVKNPLDEVNEKTNLTVSFDKIKDGKNVVGFRFNCSEKATSVQISKDTDKQQLDEIKVINEEQAELAYFKNRYPEEFAEALKIARQQNELPFGDSFEIAYEADAVEILKKQGLK
ncbi:Protein involved in initiation of plasmid replication [Treponema sp. JC4]|uniref:replication initiation protein n=1 Tax=Treponema sp. JC4 TaxID=1124982 RepID=UPI00025AFBFB|nr:replication initiation protein [Treponema sp. JC4]EID85127.1 Protein involved in initiation of plasmid replication [Treponema sp. JC4]